MRHVPPFAVPTDDDRDHSITKIFVRCALCGRMVEEKHATNWRMLIVEDGPPLWGCDQDFAANAAEAQHRLEMLAAAHQHQTPPLPLDEWLTLFDD